MKRSTDGGQRSHRSTLVNDSLLWSPTIPEVIVSRYVSLLFPVVSCILELLLGTAKTKYSVVVRHHPSVSLSSCLSCYRVLADDA